MLVETHGARATLLLGYVFLLLAFVWMLLLWEEGSSYWKIGMAYAFIGIGVGLAGTPASHSLTGSVPVRRAGMASGTADLQRDLGGAIMQSVFGALLTAGYASAFVSAIGSSSEASKVSPRWSPSSRSRSPEPSRSPSSYPKYADQITAAAKSSFLQGDDWAYSAGVVAILLGAVLVFFCFPRKEAEQQLLRDYAAQDRPSRLPSSPPSRDPELTGMWRTHAQLVPIGIAAAVSMIPIMATILILVSDKRDRSALPYTTGWVLGVAAFVTLATVAAQFLPEGKPPRHRDTAVFGVVEVVIGGALIILGVVTLVRRRTKNTGGGRSGLG